MALHTFVLWCKNGLYAHFRAVNCLFERVRGFVTAFVFLFRIILYKA